MAGQLRYELIGDASQFRSAAKEAASASEQLDTSIQEINTSVRELTDGQVQLRDEQGRFVSSAREAANASEVQAAALQELNSEGIETTQQIREQIDRLEQLEAIYGDDANAARELSDAQQRLRTQLSEVGASAAQQNQDLSRLDQEFDQATVTMTDFASRQDMLQQELRATAAAQDRVSSSGVTMRSSVSAAANNLGFEFAQAAQDARFGMAGVANQLPLMFEQFSQLTARAGSSTAALQALGRSLLGPAGLILAVTQLAQTGPQIIGWLTGASEQMSILGAQTDEAEDQLQSYVETSRDLDRLPQRLSQVATSIRDRLAPSGVFGTLRERGFTSEVEDILARPGQTAGGTPFTVETSLERVQQMLSGTSVEARTLRRALEEVGVPIETILQGSVEQATEAIRENQEALRNWQDNLRSFAESPEAFVEEALTQFQELQQRQRGLFETGVISEEDFLENQRSFLEDQIRLVQQQSPFDIRQEQFQPLLNFYRSLGGELENIQEESEDAGEEGEESLSAFEQAVQDANERSDELRNTWTQLKSEEGVELAVTQRAIQRWEAYNEALRNANRLLALRREGGLAQGVPSVQGMGEGPQVLQNIQELSGQTNVLEQYARRLEEAAVSAEALARATEEANDNIQRWQENTEDASDETENAGDNVDENINQKIAQSIQLAAQLGSTLVQSAREGGLSFQQAFSSVLQTVGSVLALSGNPIAGAAISGTGTLVGSFQSGGRVDTPFQWVGERGPELAALPQGTQVYDHETSMRMAEASASRRQSVNVNVESELTRLPGGDLGLIVRENQSRREKFGYDQ